MSKKGNIFNSVAFPSIGSNHFNLSHDVKLSFKMGRLIPTMAMEVVPGDRIKINSENMLRFAPLVSPVMHRINVTTHYYFVPNRLLWSNWEKWITGDLEVEAPYVNLGASGVGMTKGTIGDYLGYPTVASGSAGKQLKVSPLPVAAYLKIYDEYYRDQNLQDEIFQPLTDGLNSSYLLLTGGLPLQRAWMHDYFTSALPFAQKGDAVQIPVLADQDAAVIYKTGSGNGSVLRDTSGSLITTSGDLTHSGAGLQAGGGPAAIDPNGTLVADVQSSAADINSLRRAFRLQEWLERNARGGTRYIENILAHFGVKSSDARLQRPEYLGGNYQRMTISEVLSTAQTETDVDQITPVGYLGGHGISVGSGKPFKYYAEEHGWIIGIINVQPVTAYQQGLQRQFSRFDRLDYFWPTFANIGEQEVKVKELFSDIPTAEHDETFGYVPRYAEYKYQCSRVAGDMRDNLAFWHMGRIFDSKPGLNDDFVRCDPSDRIFAVQDGSDHIYGHIYNNVHAIRKMPKYGIPTI